MGIFERLYYFSVVFTNTMKHIHFHAVGNKFDRLHSVANEYYEKSNEDSDLFGEWAMEYGEEIQNPSDAAKLLDVIVETIINIIGKTALRLSRIGFSNTLKKCLL